MSSTTPGPGHLLTPDEHAAISAAFKAREAAEDAIEKYQPRLLEALPRGVWIPVPETGYRLYSDGAKVSVAHSPKTPTFDSLKAAP